MKVFDDKGLDKLGDNIIVISVDPQVNKSAFAFYYWQGETLIKPKAVATIDTITFIKDPIKSIYAYIYKDYGNPVHAKHIAIIEDQYISTKGPEGKPDKIQSVLRLSKAANQIAGALLCNDFEVIYAPVWGKKKSIALPKGQTSWMQEMFYVPGQRCNRAHNKKMSVKLAKEVWPLIRSVDEADAINIGRAWFLRNKFNLMDGGFRW